MRTSFLLLLSLCGWVEAAVDPQFLIQNYHVGPLSADMKPAEAAKQYPAHRVKWWEPYSGVHVIDIDPAKDPSSPPALRLHLDRDQQTIWLIAIADKRYQTSKGIAIGSTFGMLRKAHPRLNIHTEEGEMDRSIVAEILDEGIACVLHYDDATWKAMQAQPNRRDVSAAVIPDTQIIESISIVRKPSTPPAATAGWTE